MESVYGAKILIVDDSKELQKMLREMLEKEGYKRLVQAYDCKEAEELFIRENPDFVILDIMLPDGDGFSLLREFQKSSKVPVLFLSAKDEDEDRLLGLGLGADDYMTKPFLMRELLLRMAGILKRTYLWGTQQQEDTQLLLGGAKIDLDRACVSWEGDGRVLSLTAKELAILKKLSANRGRIVTLDSLCNAVWGDGYYGYENTLMVHIRRLREKIEENPSAPQYLVTVRGLGYRLK